MPSASTLAGESRHEDNDPSRSVKGANQVHIVHTKYKA